LPGVGKLGWNAVMVRRQLDQIEAALPGLEASPKATAAIHESLRRYLGKLAGSRRKLPFLARVGRILDRTRAAHPPAGDASDAILAPNQPPRHAS
jgi:hypothetical protein